MKISELLEKIIDNRGKTPPVADGGHCLLEINCIAGQGKYPDYSLIKKYVSEEVYHSWFRSGHPRKGDILIPTVGTLDAVGVMDRDDCCIAQNLVAFRTNVSVCDGEYLYYLLCSSEVRQRVLNLDIGAVQPSIKVPHLKNLDVEVPSLPLQRKIAGVLSCLDEKIALNNKINGNLADLLQAVYQERFGDVSSVTNQGILSDLCLYSRDRVAVSELDVSTYFSTENMLPGKVGATEATSLPTTPYTTACHEGDTLISNIRPYFKKIVYCENECGCSTDVLCFSPTQPLYAAYLFSTLYADKFFAFMVAGAKGTKMPRGDKQQIMAYPVALPSDKEFEEFNALAVPVLAQIRFNKGENKRLSAVRELLLPKLMSGEIDVSDIQL